MNLEILTQTERIQIEEECNVIMDLHPQFRMRGLGIFIITKKEWMLLR